MRHHFSRVKNSTRLAGLRWVAVLVALVFATMYFVTALPRVFYPYDLDFIEDGLLMTSLRMAQVRPIFIPPNADFVPHVYMPLYSWLGGLLFYVVGPAFLPLRLLSLTAALVTCGLIFWIARRESGLWWIGFVCAGLFWGGYRISGFWYELARVDMLYVALVLGGTEILSMSRDRLSNRRLFAAALILALAFFAKQTALLFGATAITYLLFITGKRAGLFAVTWAGLVVIPAILLYTLTNGWFFYYTVDIAAINPVEPERIFNYVTGELCGVMAGLSLMAFAAGVLGVNRQGAQILWSQPWFIWISTAVVVSGVGRASVGGNLNNLIPAYTFLCLTPALLAREWRLKAGLIPAWGVGLISLVILVQFALGGYNPLRYIPDPELRQSGDQLVERIAGIDGEVLLMMHPYYVWLAGKTPSAQMATLWHARQRGSIPLPDDFIARIQSQHYATIISDESLFETEPDFMQLLNQYYYPVEILPPAESPVTTTGMRVRPTTIYQPK